MEDIILTDKGSILLAYLQDHDQIFVGKDLIELTGIKGIYPVLNSLIRNGLVMPQEAQVRDFTNNQGKTFPKEYKTYSLTDKGRNFNIDDNVTLKIKY